MPKYLLRPTGPPWPEPREHCASTSRVTTSERRSHQCFGLVGISRPRAQPNVLPRLLPERRRPRPSTDCAERAQREAASLPRSSSFALRKRPGTVPSALPLRPLAHRYDLERQQPGSAVACRGRHALSILESVFWVTCIEAGGSSILRRCRPASSMVEQETLNLWVEGSSPSRVTILKIPKIQQVAVRLGSNPGPFASHRATEGRSCVACGRKLRESDGLSGWPLA